MIGMLPLMTTIKSVVNSTLANEHNGSTVDIHHKVRHAAFADDLTGAGKIYSLQIWWDAILIYGPLLGYFAKPSKSWLIVKDEHLEQAKMVFAGVSRKKHITSEGNKHLGVGLGSEENKISYVKDKVSRWVREVEVLSKIALVEPHAAYSALNHGVKHQYTYVMRTIPFVYFSFPWTRPLIILCEHCSTGTPSLIQIELSSLFPYG